jgi:hypothetical protein
MHRYSVLSYFQIQKSYFAKRVYFVYFFVSVVLLSLTNKGRKIKESAPSCTICSSILSTLLSESKQRPEHLERTMQGSSLSTLFMSFVTSFFNFHPFVLYQKETTYKRQFRT